MTITEQKNKSKGLYIAAVCCCLAGFFCMLIMVLTDTAHILDDPIRFWFYDLRSDALTAVVLPFTHSIDWYFVTAFCILLLIIPRTRKRYGIPVAVTTAAVTIINNVIKPFVDRPRPDDVVHLVTETSSSFPSGHAVTTMALFSMLIILTRRYIKNAAAANLLTALYIIPMIGIGLSRIYCGVHYPTDVFAGWFIGLATTLSVYGIMTGSERLQGILS